MSDRKPDSKSPDRLTRDNLKFRAQLIDSIPNPVFYKDADGIYQDCNQAFAEKVLGLPRQEVLGKTVYDMAEVIPPELADVYHEADMELIKNPGAQSYEAQVKYADGTLHDVVFNKATLGNGDGDVTGIIGVMLDVTQQRQAQAQEQYAVKIKTASEIAERAATILDPRVLLDAVIPLIKERFDLYHVHVYIVDRESGVLRLAAGYGEVGRKMLEEGHSISLDAKKSLVARAARTQDPILVDDVSETPNFMPNPLLPETKSEIAVPAIAGGEVLGVFDVQHDEVEPFSESDVAIFTTLAGQIATALHNARQFEALRSHAEFEALITQISTEFLNLPRTEIDESIEDALKRIGEYIDADRAYVFQFSEDGNQVDTHQWCAEGIEAQKQNLQPVETEDVEWWLGRLKNDESIVISSLDELPPEAEFEKEILAAQDIKSTLVMPITYRGDLFGFLEFDAVEQARTWSELEINFLNFLSDIFANAMARLRAVADLIENERQLSTLMGNLPGMAYRMLNEPDWPAQMVSEGAEALTGYTPEDLTMETQNLAYGDLIIPEDQDRVWEIVQQGVEAHEPYQIIYRIKTADDQIKWVWEQGQGVYDEAGELLALEGFVTDITERREAEAAVAESEEQYRTLINHIQDVIFSVGPNGTLLSLNPAFTTVTGWDTDAWIGKHFVELVPPSYIDMAQQKFGELMAGGQLPPFEIALRSKDRDQVLVEVSASPQVEEGEIVSILGIFRDITERKEAERALQLARTSIEGAGDAFFWFDADANFIDVSDTTCQVLGYSREALLDMCVFDIDPAFPEEAWPGVREQVEETGSVTLESQHETKAGDTFPVQVTVSYLKFSGEDIYFAVAKDITKRKEIEATLAESEAQHRTLVESMQDGIYIIQDGKFYFANESLADMLGYEVDELIGREFAPLVAPEDRAEVFENYQRRIAGEDLPPRYEARLLHKDGHAIPTLLSASALELGDESLSMGTVRDITGQKEAQAERERFTTRLETAAEISEQVGSILDPDELLETVIPLIKERFGLYYVHVYTVDDETNTLNLRAGYGEAGEKMLAEGHSISLDAEQSLVARAARTKAPVLVDDVSEDPNFLPNPLLPDTQTEVAVPAIAGGKVLGVFDVQHDEAHAFTDADLDVFLTLATQIANTFGSADTIEQTRTRLRVSQALADTETEDEVLDVLTEQARIYPEAQVALMLVDDEADELTMEIVRTEASESGLPTVPKGTRFTEQNLPVLQYLSPTDYFVIQDVSADERMDPQSREFMAEMGIQGGANIPIAVGDAWLGMLVINVKQKNFFDRKKLNLYHTLADQGATALRIARLNRATAESEQRLSLMVKQSPLAVIEWDTDFEVVSWNPAAQEIFGYTEEEALGHHAAGLIVPEQVRPLVNQVWEDLLHQRGGTRSTNANFTKDGREIICEWYNTPLVDAEGNVLGVSSLVSDITARVEAEQQLRLFQSLAENAVDAFTMSDFEGNITYANRATYELLGYDYDLKELAGTSVSALAPKEEQPRQAQAFQQIVNEGTGWSGEASASRKDGSTVDVSLTMFPILDDEGQPISIAAILRDISERKRTEKALRENEQRLSAATRIAKMGYWEFDVETQMFTFNDQYYQTFHNTTAEEVGGYQMSAAEFAQRFVPPEDAPAVAENIQKALEATDPDFQLQTESRNLTIDGEERWVSVWLTIEKDAKGRTVKLHGVNQDITERKRAEAERERFTARLEVASTITTRVNEILDPDQLLEEVIPLIKERFGLYYVHVYTVDSEAGTLDLAAGYGETGEKMLSQGHSIPLDAEQSLVARAARMREPILVDDVAENPDFLPNPLIPETRTEVAVPAIAGGEVFGVFDVQHDEAHYFTDADLDVFTTLAGQIATAFRNAQSFTEQQRAETEAQEAAENVRAIFNSVYDAIFIHDLDGTILDVNDKMLEIYGVSREEAVDFDIAADYSSSDNPLETLPGTWEQVVNGQPALFEWKARRPHDGTLFDAEVFLRRITMGEQDVIMANIRDITERKRFTARLETAAEISEQVGAILDPDELLEAVIPLIKERFGLYYVHVYTMDEQTDTLDLAAGYGEAGEKMLAEGHSIPLDAEKSLVARAAREKEPILVDDVTEDPDFLPNPLLPKTKTEVAVPAIAGGKVLGVFDVQHDAAHTFTDADTDVFLTLAGQIANAFQSAALFEEAEEERDSAQRYLDLAGSTLVALDTQGNVALINQTGCDVLGFTEDEILGRNWFDLVVPEELRAESKARFPQLIAGEVEPRTEYTAEVITKSGSRRTLHWHDRVLWDDAGNITGTLSSGEDITERLAMQKERERFATQLSTASEIAAQINQILDPDQLLRETVTLLKERFGLYHAHVYTVDENGMTLNLRFGYGRPGKIMLRQGHNIPVDREHSLVAQAARTRDSVLVNDVTSEPGFMPNALLPDTKAELAVPLITGGETLGVFDVQVDEAGYFTDADVDVFETLANQIATALENAELFERQEEAEMAMRESAEKIRAVFDAISDGIGVSNMMGEITDVNDGLLNLCGYDTREDVIGRNTMELIAREDWPKTTEGINQTVSEGRSPRQEVNLVKANGDKFIGEVGASLLYDEEGEPSGIISVIRDITERKAAERDLEMTRSSVEASGDAFYWFDADANFIDVNQGSVDLLGYSREELLNLQVFDVDPTFPRDAWPGLKEQVKAQGAIAFEGVNQTKDGEQIPVNVVVSYLPFEDQEIFFSIARDITEQKAARDAILQERNFSDTVINGLPGVFYLYDSQGKLVRWNENFQQILGYSEEELRQRPATDFIAEEDRPTVAARMEQVYQEGQSEIEAQLLTKDGTKIPFYFTGIRAMVDGEPYLAGVGIDMTAQKAARDAILQERNFSDTVINGLPGVFYLYDSQGKLVRWNENFQQILGYSEEDLRQRPATDFIAEEDRATIAARMEQVYREGQSETEAQLLTKDGTKIPFYFTGIRAMVDGEPYLAGVGIDMTVQKKAQATIQRNQERLSRAQRTAHLGSWEWDFTTDKTTWSDENYRLSGYEPGAIEPNFEALIEMVHPEDRNIIRESLEAIQNGERDQDTYQYRLILPNGNVRWIEGQLEVVFDDEGALERMTGTNLDITERKHAEEERERFTVQLSTAADIATQASAILDPDELLTETVNLLCERFNLYHTHVYTLDGKRLRLRAGYGKAGQVMLEEGHTIPLNREQSLVARAARSREIIVAQDVTQEPGFMPNPLLPETKAEIAVPLVIGDEVLGVFDAQAREVGRFIERDIDVFRTLAGQLATAVQNAVYVEELQRTTNRLREVDRLKSEFLANMSHELRTPLNSIIGYAEIMMMGIDGDMDPETLEDIKAIYENGQHLLAMINDILDLAKIEAGRLTLKFEEDVDLTQVLEESESSNASLFANKPVDLRLVIEDELPNIRADRLRLHQIFNNLISNAQKFTPEGHVEVRAYPQGSHWVCVTVEDTGIGIAEEDIAGIFERFEQIDGSSTRSADGTGLGLAITRELVQMHGGRIEVESEVDVGSKFTVWLPIEE